MLVPPPDDNDHGCAWREYAEHLGTKVDALQAELEVLKRAFARRTEKMGKMPKVPRPPRTPEEIAERRTEQALLRAEKVVTEEKTEPVPDRLKKCHLCGGTNFRSVGTGRPAEIYSYVPGYFRRVIRTREVIACRCGGCVITAPAPERWAEKTRYDASFVAHLVVSKCLIVTPLYRLEQSFARLGMPVARSTMNDLFRRAGQKLEPLRAPLFDAIKNDFLVHVDETSFTMTKQKSKAFIWAFVGRSLTGYMFALSRGGDVPISVLGDSSGAVLCDDYRGYDPLAKKGARFRCGCLAHARRKFFEAGDVAEAKDALIIIGAMYAVEYEAERRGVVGTPEHLALRRDYTRAFFVRLLRLARELRRMHGPKTLLGRAARYTWSNQRELARALRDPRIPLDNNRAENALRVVALGRKNFLFVHSEEAGKELALLYSLVVSCTRVGVNPVEYLADVLDRIDKTADANYAELLPDRWKPPPKPADPNETSLFDA
ncbi:MAG: IS66 family transposase [Myxococcales bacterium]|nr:IS66 family transposase [Myxococcales bacterium]